MKYQKVIKSLRNNPVINKVVLFKNAPLIAGHFFLSKRAGYGDFNKEIID